MYNTFIAHINITQRHEIYKEAIICILNCSLCSNEDTKLVIKNCQYTKITDMLLVVCILLRRGCKQ